MIEFSNQTSDNRWCTRLQTPYYAEFPTYAARKAVYRDFCVKRIVKLSVEISEDNFSRDVRMRRNFRSEYWEIDIIHDNELDIIDDDLIDDGRDDYNRDDYDWDDYVLDDDLDS